MAQKAVIHNYKLLPISLMVSSLSWNI